MTSENTTDANYKAGYMKGHVYTMSSAVNPLKDGFIYYFLDIKGDREIQVNFGNDRYFTIGSDSRLFIERRNSDGKWEQEHFAVSSLCQNESLEFDIPEYLTSIDVEYEIPDKYDFYNGCDTNFDMIWTSNFDIKTGKSIYYDFIEVDFKAQVLTIGGKTVNCIQQKDIKSTKVAIDFLLHHINDKAEVSMKKLGEILDGIDDVERNSTGFEIVFSDGTRSGGFFGERINWDDDKVM